VFFCPRQDADCLEFVLQKPSRDRIRELSATHLFLIDTGIWLLSERAVMVLMEKTGWDRSRDAFGPEGPGAYDLYSEMGPCLGVNPSMKDEAIGELSSAVVPLPDGEFYHFGASRHLIESVTRLQNLVVDQRRLGSSDAKPHPSQHTQNAVIEPVLVPDQHDLWIENASVPATWTLTSEHVLTGVPDNDWQLSLDPGVCLDFAPVNDSALCIRMYGIDDVFRGPIGDPASRWLGQPAGAWFAARGLDPASVGIDPQTDLQDAPLFPAEPRSVIDGDWVAWLVAAEPCRGHSVVRSRVDRKDRSPRVGRPAACAHGPGAAAVGGEPRAQRVLQARFVGDGRVVCRDWPPVAARPGGRSGDRPDETGT
jgi:hypothetical protein